MKKYLASCRHCWLPRKCHWRKFTQISVNWWQQQWTRYVYICTEVRCVDRTHIRKSGKTKFTFFHLNEISICSELCHEKQYWYFIFNIYSYISHSQTSNTMQWVLYELARRPEIQKRLYDEVSSVIPSGERCTYQHLQHLPYLKAIIKEVLRYVEYNYLFCLLFSWAHVSAIWLMKVIYWIVN